MDKYLETNDVLIDKDGNPSKAEELVLMKEGIRGLLTDNDLSLVYPDKKIIHKDCKPHRNLKIKQAPKGIYEFLVSSESEELVKVKTRKKDVKWFKRLCSMLAEKYRYGYFYEKHYHYNVEHDDIWNRMRSFHRPIILTDNYKVANIGECFIGPKKIRVPEQIKNQFKIVHPKLAIDARAPTKKGSARLALSPFVS